MEKEVLLGQGGFSGKVPNCTKIGVNVRTGQVYIPDNNGQWVEFIGAGGSGGVYTAGADIGISSNVISNTSTFSTVVLRGNTSARGVDFTDGAGQHVTITTPTNSGWVKSIIIDQPTSAIYLKNGNSDSGNGSSIQRLGNNQAQTRLTSANATNSVPATINGFWTIYNGTTLKVQIGVADTTKDIGLLQMISSGAANPTTSDIPSGFTTQWKNTTSGEVRTWVNDAGTMKSSAAFT